MQVRKVHALPIRQAHGSAHAALQRLHARVRRRALCATAGAMNPPAHAPQNMATCAVRSGMQAYVIAAGVHVICRLLILHVENQGTSELPPFLPTPSRQTFHGDACFLISQHSTAQHSKKNP
jgi:hypothetical protein